MTDVPQGKQTVSDGEIVAAMSRHPDPAFTTSELAGMFDMTAEGIRRRLESLRERNEVYKKKPTERTVIWWVPADQSERMRSA